MSNSPTHCDSLSQTLCLSMVWHDVTANVFTAWQHCAYETPKSTNTYYYLMWVRWHSSSYRVVIILSGHPLLHLLWSVFLSWSSCLDSVFVLQLSSLCVFVRVWAVEVVAGTAFNPNRWRQDCVGGLNLHHAEESVAAGDCVGCGVTWLLIWLKKSFGQEKRPREYLWVV